MPTISLSDLNIKSKCNEPVEFEPTDSKGNGMGITVLVLGAHSDVVQKHVNKELNRRRKQDFLKAKKGKDAELVPVEEDIEFGIEATAIRIVGWEGIAEDYSPENAIVLCSVNPDICSQIREFSEDIGNFTKG